MKGKCQKEKDLARLAKQFTVFKLRGAKVIELRNMQRGKYFRIVADVYRWQKLNRDAYRISIRVCLMAVVPKVKDWCK